MLQKFIICILSMHCTFAFAADPTTNITGLEKLKPGQATYVKYIAGLFEQANLDFDTLEVKTTQAPFDVAVSRSLFGFGSDIELMFGNEAFLEALPTDIKKQGTIFSYHLEFKILNELFEAKHWKNLIKKKFNVSVSPEGVTQNYSGFLKQELSQMYKVLTLANLNGNAERLGLHVKKIPTDFHPMVLDAKARGLYLQRVIGSSEIHITSYFERKIDFQGFKKTFAHELGHAFWFSVLTDAQRKTYLSLSWKKLEDGSFEAINTEFVSDYSLSLDCDTLLWNQTQGGCSEPVEDFAEHFADMLTNTGRLFAQAPSKYEFLKQEIFQHQFAQTAAQNSLKVKATGPSIFQAPNLLSIFYQAGYINASRDCFLPQEKIDQMTREQQLAHVLAFMARSPIEAKSEHIQRLKEYFLLNVDESVMDLMDRVCGFNHTNKRYQMRKPYVDLIFDAQYEFVDAGSSPVEINMNLSFDHPWTWVAELRDQPKNKYLPAENLKADIRENGAMHTNHRGIMLTPSVNDYTNLTLHKINVSDRFSNTRIYPKGMIKSLLPKGFENQFEFNSDDSTEAFLKNLNDENRTNDVSILESIKQYFRNKTKYITLKEATGLDQHSLTSDNIKVQQMFNDESGPDEDVGNFSARKSFLYHVLIPIEKQATKKFRLETVSVTIASPDGCQNYGSQDHTIIAKHFWNAKDNEEPLFLTLNLSPMIFRCPGSYIKSMTLEFDHKRKIKDKDNENVLIDEYLSPYAITYIFDKNKLSFNGLLETEDFGNFPTLDMTNADFEITRFEAESNTTHAVFSVPVRGNVVTKKILSYGDEQDKMVNEWHFDIEVDVFSASQGKVIRVEGSSKDIVKQADGSYMLLVHTSFPSLNSDYFVSGVRFKPHKDSSTQAGPEASMWSFYNETKTLIQEVEPEPINLLPKF